MRTRQHTAPATSIAFLIIALLLAISGGSIGAAQTGDPPPDTGQVIAHGIDALPGTATRWELGIITAPVPGDSALFGSFRTGFAAGWEQPVIATEGTSGLSTYLEPGQAVFHPGSSTLRVTSTTGVDEGFIYIELTTAQPSLGAEFTGDAFTAPAGTHDLRLTSSILQPDASSRFEPVNSLPYLVYAYDGAVQVAADNGSIVDIPEGTAAQVVGPASLWASPDAGAHWMIASIGAQVTVPPLPTPVTPVADVETGSLVIQLLRCPDGTDPLIAPTECVLSDTVWDITLSPQGDTDPASRRTLVEDAVDIGYISYRFTDLPVGTWVVQPDMSWMSPEQRIEITGDTVPLGGIWGVEIKAGAEAELYVYLIDPQASAGTGELVIEMYDCPPGIDPMVDPTGCTLSVDAPNVEVSRITQSEMLIFNSQSDASTPEPGLFIFQDIPSGRFLMQLDETGTWLPDEVVIGGDAFFDTGFWTVIVPADGSAYVPIYHTPAGPPAPTPDDTATGQLWITQIDCPSGTLDPTAEPGCMPSDDPWQVIVTSVATGDQWTLSDNAYSVAPGSWAFDLPAGEYGIYVATSGSWDVTYDSFANVTDGGLTEVMVYSIAPGSP